MKALKEKRVSLRSLFRRSLVILSLLALAFAFASCSGDSGGTGGSVETEPPTNGGTGPTNPPAAAWVKTMTVLKHPNVPSYEGAMPNLKGLQVLVKWNDGKEEIVDDPEKFNVYPPVAYLKSTSGTHQGFSKYGEYGIQYKGDDNLFDLDAYRANVYIPAVFALSTGSSSMTIVGDIGEVYEDLGIVATGLMYEGKYTSWDPVAANGDFNSDLNTMFPSFPQDSYYHDIADLVREDPTDPLSVREEWLGFKTDVAPTANFQRLKEDGSAYEWIAKDNPPSIRKNPVSSSPEAWVLNDRDTVTGPDANKTAKYLAGINPYLGDNAGNAKHILKVKIDKFYKVNRLDYIPGPEIEKIKTVAADDADYGGNNVARTDLGALNRAEDKPLDIATREAWWRLLYDAGLKFKVTYYLEKDATATKTRVITMTDYVKAMYTVDEAGKPRATLPVFTGNNVSISGTPQSYRMSSPQHWASTDGDYNLNIALYYYSDLIETPKTLNATEAAAVGLGNGDPYGYAGKGDLKLDLKVDYETANAATIPLSEIGLIAQFSGFKAVRKDDTDHPGEPTVTSAPLNADSPTSVLGPDGKRYPYSRVALYEVQLPTYWDVYWTYENTRSSEEVKIKIPSTKWVNNVAANMTTGNTRIYKEGWYSVFGTEKTSTPGQGKDRAGLTDYDFDEIEETEIRTCTVLFPAPKSVGRSEDDELDFDYRVTP